MKSLQWLRRGKVRTGVGNPGRGSGLGPWPRAPGPERRAQCPGRPSPRALRPGGQRDAQRVRVSLGRNYHASKTAAPTLGPLSAAGGPPRLPVLIGISPGTLLSKVRTH